MSALPPRADVLGGASSMSALCQKRTSTSGKAPAQLIRSEPGKDTPVSLQTNPHAAVCIRQKHEDSIGTSAQAVAMSRRCLMIRASACLPSLIRHS